MFKLLNPTRLLLEGLFSSNFIVSSFQTKCVPAANWSYVHPGRVTEGRKAVPSFIPHPPYAKTGKVPDLHLANPPILRPEIKNDAQIAAMRRSCRLASFVLNAIGSIIKIGTTTEQIDEFAHELIINNAAYPSPLNYRGFPKSVCTSVNNVACHGIPDDRPLEDGDIINVDVSVYLAGFHGDCSKTWLVGNVDEAGKRLVKVAQEAMMEGVKICKPGEYFFTIGKVVQDYVTDHGYTCVGGLAGHGIGTYFHGPPDVFFIYNANTGRMQPGMTFTIEPAICEGQANISFLQDGWTIVTEDKSRSAQFEHTVLITEDGHEILTK